MTAPRQILPGTTYLVTRRCLERTFFLRPSRLTNATVGYLLAVAAARYEIQVHAFCVLSNHMHLVVTDPGAQLPAFHRYLDSLVARAVNASLGRWETFWAPHSYSAVPLTTPEDVIVKAAYVLANPVAAGLVESADRWPGLWSKPADIAGDPIEFQRPRHFFRAKGRMPERAELQLVAPPGFRDAAAFRVALCVELEAQEVRAREEVHAAGKGFLGEAQVLKVSPRARPASIERRRGLNPRVAGRDKWKRIEALHRLKAFVNAYRAALRSWRRGVAGVVFPAGTYLVRVTHGVPCAAAG
jgi:REP element-mobilizing transposase RayT